MKFRKNKKGFTIVELIIVIAVIGILTAVMVPTIVHLVNKANKASDEVTVNGLNKALALRKGDASYKKPSTMYETVKGLEEYGYKADSLIAKSDEEILYDLDKDEFVMEGSDSFKSDRKAYYWRVQKEVAAEQKSGVEVTSESKDYNIYALKNFEFKEGEKIAVGFDAGESSVSSVEFNTSADKEVVIRTNGENSSLKVNAPAATVHHYDFLDSLNVQAINSASYHEHGRVRNKAVISQGHIEIEEGAVVPQISVESATGSVKVTANEPTIITVDDLSSSNTSVVSNSKEVYVDGVDSSAVSGSESSSVVFPTEIDTETKLHDLLEEGGLAKLTADIALTQKNYSYVRSELAGGNTEEASVATNKNVVLNLNGHNITGQDLADDIDFIAIDTEGKMRIYNDSETRGKIIANAKMFYVRGSLEIVDGDFVSTVLTAGTDFRSMIIADKDASVVIRDGKFVTPKCVITSWGNVTVDDGEFICASADKGWKDAKGQSSFAYAFRFGYGDNYINGGEFYGLHGGISCEGGKATIANVYSEASEETLAKFGAYVEANNIKIHVLNNRANEFLVDEAFVASKKASFKSSVHYGLYVCGEDNVVYATVNSGTFKSTDKHGVLVGNNNDGGKGLYAHTTINDGTFIGAENALAVKETGITISYGAGYTEIFGGVFSTDVTSLMKDTVNYRCVEQSDGTWKVSKR